MCHLVGFRQYSPYRVNFSVHGARRKQSIQGAGCQYGRVAAKSPPVRFYRSRDMQNGSLGNLGVHVCGCETSSRHKCMATATVA